MAIDQAGPDAVVELSAEESRALLESTEFGRIGVVLAGRPEIFPVNYVAQDGHITFRSSEGTKLLGLTVHEHVVFEIDDHTDTEAWSVVAKGRARVLQTQEEIDAADELPLRPWVATLKRYYIQIEIDELSGRRFVFGEEPEEEPETAS
ncbi:pyridoxamine 5'-phosphate oxidase family protein [Sediminivirga luteola]|uniref:Pyridoxamine 5'-phosphate oxidase family protein n=1 Tax=Sediminivirga luteola TaxID=1774748 RepID=A0A8J2U1J9_9MICO|nr:pyridoxamine 5'-phosphate oxidase family protein [Sediminivirga luteola]MCI2265187.1 pyridoxamine 5'-phosphate oxidase family protein [Sediminivirga luteola]GGA29128.1 hypothetical protein GCM10011333_34680 [Sediminivirga luteola]